MPTKPVRRKNKIYKTLNYLRACPEGLKWGSRQTSFREMLSNCPNICWFTWLLDELEFSGYWIINWREKQDHFSDGIFTYTASFLIYEFIHQHKLMKPICDALEAVYKRATREA